MRKRLIEGLRFGGREKSRIMASLEDFAFGFEIEMNSGGSSGDEFETFQEYIEDLIHNAGLLVSDSETADIATAILDVMGESFIFRYDDLDLSYINSTLLEDIESILPMNNKTNDMFVVELMHGIIETLIDNEIVLDEIAEVLADFGERDLMLGLVTNEDIDVDDEDEKSLSEMFTLYHRILSKLSELISTIPTEIWPDLPAFNELTDSNKDTLVNFYHDEMEQLVGLKSTIQELKEHEWYRDTLDFTLGADSSDKQRILEKNLDSLFQYSIEFLELLAKVGINNDTHEIISQLISVGFFETHRNDYEEQSTNTIDEDALDDFINDEIEPHLTLSDSVHAVVESDGQIEIISYSPVSGDDIITHYEDMKTIIELLVDKGFQTQDNSGLHLSISFKHGMSGINKNKFIVLSQIFQMIEEDKTMTRNYVDSMYSHLKDNIDGVFSLIQNPHLEEQSLQASLIEYFEKYIDVASFGVEKYHSINFANFNMQNGRVEMRLFGGVDYQEKLDDYFEKLIKLMYVLQVSTEDTHDAEYYKGMYQIVDMIFHKIYHMTISEARYNYRTIKKLMAKLDLASMSDLYALVYENKDRLGTIADSLLRIDNTSSSVYSSPIIASTLKNIIRMKRNA